MTNILITGGAGFIGKRLALALRTAGHKVTVFDNFHPQVHVDADGVKCTLRAADVDVIVGDVRDTDALRSGLVDHDVRVVVHLAAETGTGQSFDLPERYCDVNITGTACLIEAVRGASLAGTKVDRMLLAGSRAVYGEGACQNAEGRLVTAAPRFSEDLAAGDFAPKDAFGATLEPVPSKAETTVVAPASIYASTKLMQEYIFRQGLEQSGIACGILRLQNVYGAGQSLNNPYTGVLPTGGIYGYVVSTLNIFEDGEIVRDFVNVSDVIAAFQILCVIEHVPHKAIDIGSGQSETILGVSKMMVKALELTNDRLSISGQFRPGDIRHALAVISDAKSLLGWEPKVSLEHGMLELLDWARDAL